MSNFCKIGRGEGKNIFFMQKHEKANFHDIAVEKSNSGKCHIPDTRRIRGTWVLEACVYVCVMKYVQATKCTCRHKYRKYPLSGDVCDINYLPDIRVVKGILCDVLSM
jgi:hypothetical protein